MHLYFLLLTYKLEQKKLSKKSRKEMNTTNIREKKDKTHNTYITHKHTDKWTKYNQEWIVENNPK